MALRCGFTDYTISRKKSLLNVKFSPKIQVSIRPGFIPSPDFQDEMLALTLFTVPHFKISYGTVKVTFEFPFHQLKNNPKLWIYWIQGLKLCTAYVSPSCSVYNKGIDSA